MEANTSTPNFTEFVFNPLTKTVVERITDTPLITFDPYGFAKIAEVEDGNLHNTLREISQAVRSNVIFIDPFNDSRNRSARLYLLQEVDTADLKYRHGSVRSVTVHLPDGRSVRYKFSYVVGLEHPALVFSVNGNPDTARIFVRKPNFDAMLDAMMADLRTRMDEGQTCVAYMSERTEGLHDGILLATPMTMKQEDGGSRRVLAYGVGDGRWYASDKDKVSHVYAIKTCPLTEENLVQEFK